MGWIEGITKAWDAAQKTNHSYTRKVAVRGTRPAPTHSTSPTRTLPSQRPSRRAPTRVRRIATPYWRQRGWQKTSGGYKGYYRTPYSSYEGEIRQPYLGRYQLFITNPPKKLKKHRKWICFTHKGGGRYQIHLHTQPRDVDSAILLVERMIREAFEK